MSRPYKKKRATYRFFETILSNASRAFTSCLSSNGVQGVVDVLTTLPCVSFGLQLSRGNLLAVLDGQGVLVYVWIWTVLVMK